MSMPKTPRCSSFGAPLRAVEEGREHGSPSNRGKAAPDDLRAPVDEGGNHAIADDGKVERGHVVRCSVRKEGSRHRPMRGVNASIRRAFRHAAERSCRRRRARQTGIPPASLTALNPFSSVRSSPMKTRAATAIRRAQERFDDLALAGCRREDFGHGFAELHPVIRAETFDRRVSGGDTEFLFVRGEPPMEGHRTSLVLDQQPRFVADDLAQALDHGAQGRMLLCLAQIEIVADAMLEAMQSRAVEPCRSEMLVRKAMGRPLMMASAPPSLRCSRVSAEGSCASTTTSLGRSTMSTSVPSKSRKRAHWVSASGGKAVSNQRSSLAGFSPASEPYLLHEAKVATREVTRDPSAHACRHKKIRSEPESSAADWECGALLSLSARGTPARPAPSGAC